MHHGSPRRCDLLKKLTPDFEILVSDFDEDTIKSSENNPIELVKKLSLAKANDIFNKVQYANNLPFVIIGSDTLVSFKGKILGKPKDTEDAGHMLFQLQGSVNTVYTGTTVIIQKNHTLITVTDYSGSDVYMKNMSENDIWEYINTKEPLDKAGAYAIQGIGKKYINKFEGDFDSIVGLDVKFIEKVFKKYHIDLL